MIGIGGTAPNNTMEFTPHADTDEAYRAMLDDGVALAWTALDAATDAAIKAYLLASACERGLNRQDVNTAEDHSPDEPARVRA